MEPLVSELQEFHARNDAPDLINPRIEGQPIDFRTFLSILAESFRILNLPFAEKGINLRVADELEKQLAIAEEMLGLCTNASENDHSSDGQSKQFERQRKVARGYVKGVDQMCLFYPEATALLGPREGQEGAFFILRYMLCTVAVKSIRALYRKPPTADNWGARPWTKTRDDLLSHLEYFCTLQIACDAEFKKRGCEGVFGGGRGEMNMSYVKSQRFDWTAQNDCLRRAIVLADASGDDFVSCVSRYRLCTGIMLGGKSGMSRPGHSGGVNSHMDMIVGADGKIAPGFFVGDIATLREQAVVFEKRLESIGQLHFVEGETGQRHFVIDRVTQWRTIPQFPNLCKPLFPPPPPDDGYRPPVASTSATSNLPRPPPVPTAPRPPTTSPAGSDSATRPCSSKSHCASCGARPATNAKLLCCSRCRGAYYCNAECQKTHWKAHKPRCVAAAT